MNITTYHDLLDQLDALTYQLQLAGLTADQAATVKAKVKKLRAAARIAEVSATPS